MGLEAQLCRLSLSWELHLHVVVARLLFQPLLIRDKKPMASELPPSELQFGEQPPQPPLRAVPEPMKVVNSEDLFQGHRLIGIQHAGAIYRLQITARGKLILQK